MVNKSIRHRVGKAVWEVLKPTYFKEIPLDSICQALIENDMIMLQEDNTEWNGILCGIQGEAFFHVAPLDSGRIDYDINEEVYEPYENTGLRLTWYKCESRRDGKFEVIGYIS